MTDPGKPSICFKEYMTNGPSIQYSTHIYLLSARHGFVGKLEGWIVAQFIINQTNRVGNLLKSKQALRAIPATSRHGVNAVWGHYLIGINITS
jgi:hypothetical protein